MNDQTIKGNQLNKLPRPASNVTPICTVYIHVHKQDFTNSNKPESNSVKFLHNICTKNN